jgi:hypothetical protein
LRSWVRAGLCSSAGLPQNSNTHFASRPNIILILAYDPASDLGSYGSTIKTPTDQLAYGGLRFTQFCNAARCCPSRASLLTDSIRIRRASATCSGNAQYAETFRAMGALAEVLERRATPLHVGQWHVTPLGSPSLAQNGRTVAVLTGLWDHSVHPQLLQSAVADGGRARSGDAETSLHRRVTDHAVQYIRPETRSTLLHAPTYAARTSLHAARRTSRYRGQFKSSGSSARRVTNGWLN